MAGRRALTMQVLIARVLVLTFFLLGAIHAYWALGGDKGKAAAVPHVSNAPAFRPSASATALVALALFACAFLIAASAGFVLALPRSLLAWPCYALALILLLRAIGDFRLVGFFKRVHNSRFAWLDSRLYSPLCLALAVGVFFVTYEF